MNQSLKKELEQRALNAFHLAMTRSNKACPWWVRCSWKQKRLILRLYFRAQVKNRFRSHHTGEWYEVDHIVPLKGENVCGLMVAWNLHVIPKTVNRAKSTLIVDEWLDKSSVGIKAAHVANVRHSREVRVETAERFRAKRERRMMRAGAYNEAEAARWAGFERAIAD